MKNHVKSRFLELQTPSEIAFVVGFGTQINLLGGYLVHEAMLHLCFQLFQSLFSAIFSGGIFICFFFRGRFFFWGGVLVLCFPVSLIFCFSASLLFCFSAFLLLCFSCFLLFCFLLFLLLSFSASLFSLLLCFCTSVPFYFYQ